MRLDDAARALDVSSQALWKRMESQGRPARRFEIDGRMVSCVRCQDLGFPLASVPEAPNVATTAAESRATTSGVQTPLWEQLRDLEASREELEEHVRQLRAALQHEFERAELERADRRRIDVEMEDLHTRLVLAEQAQAAAVCGQRAAERERDRVRIELEDVRADNERRIRELLVAAKLEAARERYCDRLEHELRLLKGA